MFIVATVSHKRISLSKILCVFYTIFILFFYTLGRSQIGRNQQNDCKRLPFQSKIHYSHSEAAIAYTTQSHVHSCSSFQQIDIKFLKFLYVSHDL